MISCSRSPHLLVASEPRGYQIVVRRKTSGVRWGRRVLSLTSLNHVGLRLASVPLAWLGLSRLQRLCGSGSSTSGGMGKALWLFGFGFELGLLLKARGRDYSDDG
jgi:hypothetical protein